MITDSCDEWSWFEKWLWGANLLLIGFTKFNWLASDLLLWFIIFSHPLLYLFPLTLSSQCLSFFVSGSFVLLTSRHCVIRFTIVTNTSTSDTFVFFFLFFYFPDSVKMSPSKVNRSLLISFSEMFKAAVFNAKLILLQLSVKRSMCFVDVVAVASAREIMRKRNARYYGKRLLWKNFIFWHVGAGHCARLRLSKLATSSGPLWLFIKMR